MDLELKGHVAVVTGGASGIGAACAEALAREGCRVAVWDLTPGEGVIPVNVADAQAVQAALEATERTFGPIDHLVHSAAVGSGKFGFPFTNLEPADWPRVLEVNIMGMVNVAHAVTAGMRERRRGTMVFLASVAGQIGSQTDPPYSATKAANINFAQCLAKDLAPFGVRVNSVCPGMVNTPLMERIWQASQAGLPPERQLTLEEWGAAKLRTVVPLGRWQEPGDIADMVTFLSSARARQVTGQTINVDGGFVMHW